MAQFENDAAGEINHSKAFIARFRSSALRTLRRFVWWDLHARLPALGLPSDYVCVSDGVTIASGVPLHVHLFIQQGRRGLQYHVAGMQPVATVGAVACEEDPDAGRSASLLRFSTRPALVAHCRMIEQQFRMESNLRWAGRVGDGAETGIAELQAEKLGIQGRQRDLFGQLDVWHSCETAGFHADNLLALQGFQVKEEYLELMRKLRAKFQFGSHSALPKAVAKKYKTPCSALLAPHSEATRTLKHESVLAANSLLRNIRNLCLCQMVSLQAGINASVQDSRAAGRTPGRACGLWTHEARSTREEARSMLAPSNLLFLCLRAEHRSSGIVRYGTWAQKMQTTSSEAFLQQMLTLQQMRHCKAAAQGLRGTLRIWQLILSMYESKDGVHCGIPRANRIKRTEFKAFITTFAMHTAGRYYPRGTGRLLELMFHGTWEGIPAGLQRGKLHVFAEPVRPSDAPARDAALARQRETSQQCRARVLKDIGPALTAFLKWCGHEQHFFQARSVFHFSSWPQSLRTSNGVYKHLQSQKPLNTDILPAGPAVESQVAMEEEDVEGDVALDPSLLSGRQSF